MLCLGLACLTSWVLPAEAARFSGERWAVVIGVEEYQDPIPTLTAPIKDAEAVYQFLQTPQGGKFDHKHIQFLKGPAVTKSSIETVLGTFLNQVDEEDYILVYLSGHGMVDVGKTERFYFLPSGANTENLPGTAIRMKHIFEYIAEAPAKKKLVIADVCHSGAIAPNGALVMGDNPVHDYLKKLANPHIGMHVMTSSRASQKSQEFSDEEKRNDPEKEKSVFTYYLLQALGSQAKFLDRGGNQDGIVDIKETFNWVRESVKKHTRSQQIPQFQGDLDSGLPLAIVNEERQPVIPVPTNPGRVDKEMDLEFWKAIKDSKHAQDFLAYMNKFGEDGTYYFLAKRRYEELTKASSIPEPVKIPDANITGSSSSMAPPGMVWIPGGTFTMGTDPELAFKECQKYFDGCSKSSYTDESPRHEVTLDGFYMDRYEVSQKAFEGVMDSNPSSNEGPNNPVESVTWDEAKGYCEKVGKRLPTEAEWEYAAKGGKDILYPWGNAFELGFGNFCDVNCEYEWKRPEFNDKYKTTSPVGQYEPTSHGLYDMGGNVWEWVSDWYSSDAYKKHSLKNPKGPSSGTYRVVRGGSWGSKPYNLRAGDRSYDGPTGRTYLGFRCTQ